MGASEPLAAVSFTVLGRGFDPSAVEAFIADLSIGMARLEAAAALWAARADAAETIAAAGEQTTRILMEAQAKVVAIHRQAMRHVEALEGSCRHLQAAMSRVDVALERRAGPDDLDFVIEPDAGEGARVGGIAVR